MKFDKETLIKHRFWILLGLQPLLVIFCTIWLVSSVSGIITEKQDAINKKKEELARQKDIKNVNFLSVLEEKNKTLEKRKDSIWLEAWDAQRGLLNWPATTPTNLAELNDRPFGKDIDKENPNYAPKFAEDDVYLQQYKDMDNSIHPTQFKGGWSVVLQPVEWKSRPPSSEDLWLEQENIWVKRSLLHVVRDVNEVVSIFKEKTIPAAEKSTVADVVAEKRYENPYWRLDLKLDKATLSGKITNLAAHRQPLNIAFKVGLHPTAKPVLLKVEGNPLPPKAESDITKLKLGAVTALGIYSLEEVLDYKTVPVKEVEDLRLGYSAHRFASRPLKAKSMDEEKAVVPGATPPPLAPAPAPIPGPFGGMGQTAAHDLSKNGLVRTRYIDLTPQVRRMSVALVLVVEQTHIQDVLTSFANAKDPGVTDPKAKDVKLRMQTTQVHWQHVPDTFKPAETAAGTAGDPKSLVPGVAPRPIAYALPTGPGGTSATGQEEDKSNLVELTLYGIVSIYERYQTKPGEVTTGAAPATPTTPGGPIRSAPAATPETPAVKPVTPGMPGGPGGPFGPRPPVGPKGAMPGPRPVGPKPS